MNFVISFASDQKTDNSINLRRESVKRNVPLITTIRAAHLAFEGLKEMKQNTDLTTTAMQDYYHGFHESK